MFWAAIDGPQYSSHANAVGGFNQVQWLVLKAGHGQVHAYDSEAECWYLYTKGIRGRVNECEIPADEVPKVYRLLLTLES